MYRLKPNPYPVFNGNTDDSLGYDDSFKKDYDSHVVTDADWVKDLDAIITAYAALGYDIDRLAAYYVWYEYSNSQYAHWLEIHPEQASNKEYCESLVNNTRRFLLYEGTPT